MLNEPRNILLMPTDTTLGMNEREKRLLWGLSMRFCLFVPSPHPSFLYFMWSVLHIAIHVAANSAIEDYQVILHVVSKERERLAEFI